MGRTLRFPLVLGLTFASCGDDTVATEDCGYWSGPGFTDEWICYEIVGEWAVSGDIILGTHEELQRRRDEIDSGMRNAIASRSAYWPNGRVPYTIADDVPVELKLVIANAARDYNDHTVLRWVPRSNDDSDYVEFKMAPDGADYGGLSALGKRGGKQVIEIAKSQLNNAHAHHTVRHEMGHAIGLVHEQQRHDAGNYIDVLWDNIEKSWHAQYKSNSGWKDVLEYDFYSIMHYNMGPANRPKMRVKAGVNVLNPAAIGYGRALTAGDIADIRFLYTFWVVPWESMGNRDVRTIEVEVNQDERLELFALRNDGSLWHRWQEKPRSGWSEWSEFGKPCRELAVDRNKDGRLEVFVMDGDQAWHRWQVRRNAGWGDWHTLGAALPGVVQLETAENPDGRLEVFARRNNGEIWHIWQDRKQAGGWSAWHLFADVGAVDIDATENKDGRIELAYANSAGGVGHVWQQWNGAFSSSLSWVGPSWFGHDPSRAVRDVEIVRNKDGHLEVFAMLTAGGIEHSWQVRGGWSAFDTFRNAGVVTGMDFGINHDGRLEAFGVLGGKVEHRWQTKSSAGPWTDWVELSGTPADVAEIAVGRNEDQGWSDEAYLELFAIRGGVVYHTWQKGIGLAGEGNAGLGNGCEYRPDAPSCGGESGESAESGDNAESGDADTSASVTSDDDATSVGDGTSGGDETSDGWTSGDGTSGGWTSGDDGTTGAASDGWTSGASLTAGSLSGGDTTGDDGSVSGASVSGSASITGASGIGDDSGTTGDVDTGDIWVDKLDVGAVPVPG